MNAYVAKGPLPEGYEIVTWADQSIDVRDRLEMLVNTGGRTSHCFCHSVAFPQLEIAWVLGHPVLHARGWRSDVSTDQTLNMLSMFAFLMAIGIVVDDAIVVVTISSVIVDLVKKLLLQSMVLLRSRQVLCRV